MNDDINTTLAERGKRYGEFPDHARMSQHLKQWMRESPTWENMRFDQKEALEMIAHKISRILNGDPNYDDSWRDIAGYAMLVANRLACATPKKLENDSPESRNLSARVVTKRFEVTRVNY